MPLPVYLKSLVFVVLVPGVVAGAVPLCFFASRVEWPSESWHWHHYSGAVVFAAGLAACLHCIWVFARHGGGTPAPIDPPVHLVHRGLYRWVRNPMYLAVLGIVGGEALFLASWDIAIYWVCLGCCFQLFVVLYEEPTLTREFGAMYEDYRREVPRWLPRRPKPQL